jgi:hypothetical protein
LLSTLVKDTIHTLVTCRAVSLLTANMDQINPLCKALHVRYYVQKRSTHRLLALKIRTCCFVQRMANPHAYLAPRTPRSRHRS